MFNIYQGSFIPMNQYSVPKQLLPYERPLVKLKEVQKVKVFFKRYFVCIKKSILV